MLRGQRGSKQSPNDLLGEGQSPDSPLGPCRLPFAVPDGGKAHPRLVTCSPWQWGAVPLPQPGPGPIPLPGPGGTATLLQMSAQIPPYFGLQSTTGSIQKENCFRAEKRHLRQPQFPISLPKCLYILLALEAVWTYFCLELKVFNFSL